MNVERKQNFVLLSTHKQTAFTKSAPVFICSAFYKRCNILNPSTTTESISDKEIEEVIPAGFLEHAKVLISSNIM